MTEESFISVERRPLFPLFAQVFRKAPADAIDLVGRLLEYTPTQRLSAIQAMIHPFFDELRDPNTRLPDSRHPNGPVRDLPNLFDFSRHGKSFIARSAMGTLSLSLTFFLRRAVNRSGVKSSFGPAACTCRSCGAWSGY